MVASETVPKPKEPRVKKGRKLNDAEIKVSARGGSSRLAVVLALVRRTRCWLSIGSKSRGS